MSKRALSLHNSPWQGVIHLTGGGSGFLSELLATPGASRTVLEVVVPYSGESLNQLLGGHPDQACSATTARQLAMAAFERACTLGAQTATAIGIGVTASLATDREKKGRHRAHIALQTIQQTVVASPEFSGDRNAEETVLIDCIWQTINAGLLHTDLVEPTQTKIETTKGQPAWQALLTGELNVLCVEETNGEEANGDSPLPELLLPGSFNPQHAGHREMLTVAEHLTGKSGAYELAIVNVDKPTLDYAEIDRRTASIADRPVWLTRLPTFREKARAFPGCTFVVGADTMQRIAQERYYASASDMASAIDEWCSGGTHFVVFGRDVNGTFATLEDLALPTNLATICTGVAEADFRADISSTSIRAATN